MDGLSISNASNLIRTGQTESQRESAQLKSEMGNSTGGATFADTLKEAVGETNRLQQVADKKMEELATGRAQSIPDVMIAAEKADIALKLMVQVRNKVIDAYQEIMKMNV